MNNVVKRGLKLITTHLICIIISFFVMTAFSWALDNNVGSNTVWGIILFFYFCMIYSDGWNMAAFDIKPYNNVKATPVRALKASLFSLIIPIILIAFYFIPINAWCPFNMEETLQAGTEYIIEISGTADTSADDIKIIKIPKDESKPENFFNQKNVLTNGDFEKNDGWSSENNVAITNSISHAGERSAVFSSFGTLTHKFTPEESGKYYIGGYYKGNGKMELSIIKENNYLFTKDVSKLITKLNVKIFKVASTIWFLPLSLLYSTGNIEIYNVLYLMFIIPIISVIGYMVGTTGFSFIDKYATYKNKRIKKKKEQAEAEKAAIRKQIKQLRK